MQNFCRDVGRSSPCLNAEFTQDSLNVLADGARARPENFGDLAVPLALAHPKQHFGFAFGFAPDVDNGDGPERNEIDSGDEFGEKRRKKFPVPAEKMNHKSANAEVEDIVGG